MSSYQKFLCWELDPQCAGLKAEPRERWLSHLGLGCYPWNEGISASFVTMM